MPTFETWDIVRVPFPYVERPVRQRRPALVVAAGDLEGNNEALLWLAMITSAANRGWHGDVVISDLGEAGLPVASVVRPAKLATIEERDADRLGKLPLADRAAISRYLQNRLQLALRYA
ncbi:MAG TPA: type II toxin-antitoxin system PemK/MazF family toxin [Stellaceae bacterium]|jgi:mRNA interferase MazF|nr:type II toxin-antitoxin system PemK/MazF family toxin [Stellaceae bacterium]